LKTGRLDNQSVTLPVADRVASARRFQIRRISSAAFYPTLLFKSMKAAMIFRSLPQKTLNPGETRLVIALFQDFLHSLEP
jgi:hypothetical protein